MTLRREMVPRTSQKFYAIVGPFRLEQCQVPKVCKRWFPNGGSSSVGEWNSATPFLPQFNPLFTSILPHFCVVYMKE